MAESLDELRERAGVDKKTPKLDELRAKLAPQQTFIEKAFDFLRGKDSEGFPELGTSGPSVPAFSKTGLKLATAYATQVNPRAVADIAVKALADVDADVSQGEDKFGNPTIKFEGKTYYINAPGVSEADAFTLLGQLGAFAPAAKVGSAPRTVFKRILATGFLSSATSITLDAAGNIQGSKQGVDLTSAALIGVLGGALQGIAPAAKGIWRTIFKKPRFFDEATGKLTEQGAAVARKAGLDPVDMDRRLAAAFAEEVIDEPIPALAVTRAQEKATGIPFTRGQQEAAAGDATQAALEEGFRSGRRGAGPETALRDIDQRAAAASREALDESIGGRTMPTAQERGAAITTEVRAAEKAKRGRVDTAFEVAAPVTAAARITRDTFSGLMRDVKQGVKDLGLDPRSHPQTIQTLQGLGRLFKKAKKADILNITEVSLQRIERERRILGRKIRGMKSSEDRHALIEVRDALDGFLEKSFDDVLFSGDANALKTLKTARRESFEFHSLFSRKRGKVSDDVGAMVEKILFKDATPEQTIGFIFGAAQLGKNKAAAKAVERLREILGKTSEGWTAVRESAWDRITLTATGETKKPAIFVKDFDELMRNNKSLVDALFEPEEVVIMRGVRNAIANLRAPGRSTAGPANVSRIMAAVKWIISRRGTAQSVLHRRPIYGGVLHSIGRALPIGRQVIEDKAIRKAATQIPRPAASSPPFVSTGIAVGRETTPGLGR